MSSYRLKNVIILILLFINVSLLFLLLSEAHTRHSEKAALAEEVSALYQDSGLQLSTGDIAETYTLSTLQLQRNSQREASLAVSILGSGLSSSEQGGGTTVYSGENGRATFRSSGYFEILPEESQVDNPAEYCRRICQSYGYESPVLSSSAGERQVYAANATVEQTPVYNCRILFTFQGDSLRSVSGYLLPTGAAAEQTWEATAASALVRFLDYRTENGIICKEVLSIDLGCFLQPSASSALYLVPVFRITTDASVYYVNMLDHTVQAAN